VETSGRAVLVELAKQQLEGAIACLDELGCHQAAAHADVALNLLLAAPQTSASAPIAAEDGHDES
jgi:hypothetical protein